MSDDSETYEFCCGKADSFGQEQGYRQADKKRNQTAPKRFAKEQYKQATAFHAKHKVYPEFFASAVCLIPAGKVNQKEYKEKRNQINYRNQHHQLMNGIAFDPA